MSDIEFANANWVVLQRSVSRVCTALQCTQHCAMLGVWLVSKGGGGAGATPALTGVRRGGRG